MKLPYKQASRDTRMPLAFNHYGGLQLPLPQSRTPNLTPPQATHDLNSLWTGTDFTYTISIKNIGSASRKIHNKSRVVAGLRPCEGKKCSFWSIGATFLSFCCFIIAQSPVLVYHIYVAKFGFRRTRGLLSASVDCRRHKYDRSR